MCLLATGECSLVLFRPAAAGSSSDMEINKQENEDPLPKRVIQRDTDVTHLHLARRGLTYIPDLSSFSMLRCMWLNNNKIREVSRASFNCCLTELYLQNNDILSISGALRHLTCLQVLLLFNNQMKCLEETMSELKNMQDLHTLSLYLNPFTQDPEYRQYVLHHLPSVRFLDRKGQRGSKGKRCTDGHSDDRENPSVPKSIIQFSIMNWTGTSTSQWNHLDDSSKPASGILTVKLR
ncbi:leucine-rich repeat-containing protein 72 isoform X2 [Onychostoma macrolepis]|uniref:leucine-rich repeat-containing protein 72 isoform X2 n=1 Tax=Onychostoma macrolepis TaxID=369639 RepID=UPI00272D7B54|nr:leucine-rich repeat-containing protein 72 isoform X2 [Onychostoma macrolepis]